jgi:site-specific DNA-methyltransferase (adenine-specific)
MAGIGMVDAVIADPPYCSGGRSSADRLGKSPSQKYQKSENRGLYPEFVGDNRDQRSWIRWCSLWLSEARERCRSGGLVCLFADWRQLPSATDALQAAGWLWRGVVVWDKTEAARPQKGRYRAQAEYVVWGSNGAMPLAGPCPPGVIRCAAPRGRRHMTEKPVALFEQLLVLAGGRVLDPFMGSGSAGVACVRTGRRYIGIEADPGYFAIAVDRLAAEDGTEAAA